MRRTVEEVANLFAATPVGGANHDEEVYPGYPGVVVAEGVVRTMTWGFPLSLTGRQGQKPSRSP